MSTNKHRQMDEYGFGSAAMTGLRLFEMSGRRSGRTTRMVALADDNDVIVCSNSAEARRVEQLLRARGKKTRVTFCEPNLSALADIKPAADGRCVPDHSWVYEYFCRQIKDAEDDLASARLFVGRESIGPDVPFASSMNVSRTRFD